MALIVPEHSTTICVGNLPDYVSPREFRLLFKFAAGVERCIIKHTQKGHQVGYARFATEEEAKAAIEWLDTFPLDEEFPTPMKVFMSSTQLNDMSQGVKRPIAGGAWGGDGGMPPAKFGKGMGKGWGAGLDYGVDFGTRGFQPQGKGFGAGFGGGFGKGGAPPAYGAARFGGAQPYGQQQPFGKGKGYGKGVVSATSVYVGGVPHDWDEMTLQSLFEGFGTISRVHLSRGTNPLGNVAFVHFSQPAEATAAISTMNNYSLDGSRHLTVRAAISSPRY